MYRKSKRTEKTSRTKRQFLHCCRFKVDIQKSAAFLYISGELAQFEIKNIIPFTEPQKVRYLGINLTKYIESLCDKNYKTLLMSQNQNKWRDVPCL